MLRANDVTELTTTEQRFKPGRCTGSRNKDYIMNVALRIGVLLPVVLAASTSAQQSSMLPGGPALRNDKKMFGLIGRMTAVEGKREELMTILVNALSAVPA